MRTAVKFCKWAGKEEGKKEREKKKRGLEIWTKGE